MIIPTREECLNMLKEQNVPDNLTAHLKTVCDVSMKIVDLQEKRGINVNRELVIAGALLHDVKKISANDHVTEGYEFIKSLGFPEVALLVKRHGLEHVDDDDFVPKSWEEKIVFYADKRVKGDKIVSVRERFEYIKQRYDKKEIQDEENLTYQLEKELLGDEELK